MVEKKVIVSLDTMIKNGELEDYFYTANHPIKEALVKARCKAAPEGFTVIGISGARVVTKMVKEKGRKEKEITELEVNTASRTAHKTYEFAKEQKKAIEDYIVEKINEEPFKTSAPDKYSKKKEEKK